MATSHNVNAGRVTVSVTLSQAQVTVTRRSRKPPRPPFIDRNLEAGKVVLKETIREAIVESIKWLLSGRKRQPTQA